MTTTSAAANYGSGERAAAELACAKLVHEFGRLVDAREFEALVELFDDDAEFNRPSEPENIIRGRHALLANFRTRPNHVTVHLFSNVQVYAESPTNAAGYSHLIMYTAKPENIGALNVPIANPEARIGMFREEFVCRGGVWRFSRRVGRLLMVVDSKQS